MDTKRWMIGALVGAMLLLGAAAANAACYGFTDEQMPAAVADYLCKYEGVRRRVISVDQSEEGIWVFSQLADADGVPLARVLSFSKGPGDEYIYYFQLTDGTVLLDRRVPVEEKGQDG